MKSNMFNKKVFNTKFSKLICLDIDDLVDAITAEERSRRLEAGKYAAKIIRKNVGKKGRSTPGGFPSRRTGYLVKRIGYNLMDDEKTVIVGTRDFKAHLLEFGHGDGKERNKRPFVFPSLREAEPEIIRIMSKRYWD